MDRHHAVTATEQLLISDSMDRAVSRIDFALGRQEGLCRRHATQGSNRYGVFGQRHSTASPGQRRQAPGNEDKAEYVVEVRAGAVGTDHDDLLVGVPALTVPTVVPVPGIPTQIPEIPFVKRPRISERWRRLPSSVYNRKTGRILWQSGIVPDESRTKAFSGLQQGPFQSGSTYSGTKFAGDQFTIPLVDLDRTTRRTRRLDFGRRAGILCRAERGAHASNVGAGQSKGEP